MKVRLRQLNRATTEIGVKRAKQSLSFKLAQALYSVGLLINQISQIKMLHT